MNSATMNRAPATLTMIISDGGVPALAACLLEERAERLVVWAPPIGASCLDGASSRISLAHRSAAEAQARALGVARFEACAAFDPPTAERRTPRWAVLWLAIDAAARLGCDDVVWPVVCGADADELAHADETARSVSRLCRLDSATARTGPLESVGGPAIRLPLADLTTVQVAELALDLGAPLELVWWAATPGEPGARDAKWTWGGALRSAAERLGDRFAVLPA